MVLEGLKKATTGVELVVRILRRDLWETQTLAKRWASLAGDLGVVKMSGQTRGSLYTRGKGLGAMSLQVRPT